MIAVAAPASAQDRTFLSAVKVRQWFEQENIAPTSIDVFSANVHARRSRELYSVAFGQATDIGIIAAHPDNFDLALWWQTSAGAKKVLAELSGWVWVRCCFEPGEKYSHQELWGLSKQPQAPLSK